MTFTRLGSSVAALAIVAALAGVALPRAQEPANAPPPEFAAWLENLRAEALAQGIRAETLDRALAGLTPEPVILERDRSQPEQVQTLDAYLRQRLSARTIASAREMYRRHRTVLRRVDTDYGIRPSMLVAVWGLESNFGRFTGTRPTITALATLAFDARRPQFRSELLHALTILDRGHISVEEMKGSWAGAMGQPQFMPSSYLKHAVDFDGDGRADIWRTEADVFASIANYLKSAGWVDGERWGREVQVSQAVMNRIDQEVPQRTSGCRAVREMTVARPLAHWARLGVALTDGKPLPTAAMDASLVRGAGRHFLVYRNYHALIDYNCSNSYAISAGLLADSIW